MLIVCACNICSKQEKQEGLFVGRWSKQGCINSAREYDDLKTWIQERKTAYLAARDNGWLDECSSHMGTNIPNIEWTLDRCLASSKKYQNRIAWLRSNGEAYCAAVRNNRLAKCSAHMKSNNAPSWEFEDCLLSARACSSRFEWEKKDKAACSAARRHGWYEDCVRHMSLTHKAHTKDSCQSSASQYATRNDWFNGDRRAYEAAKRLGIFDNCCRHMPSANEITQRWTKEECILFAKKYDNQRDFASYEPAAYAAVRRNGWIHECTSHMTPLKKVRTLESCKVAAKKFKSPSSWYYNDPSAYIYACRHGWVEECCAHMKKHMDSITKNMCIQSAASFNSFKDFYMGDHIHFTVAKENGWLPEIKGIFYERNARAWIVKNLGGADG